jgi:4-amino-4-deoxy-L-arabinose transferase-like glycosyltransferase
MTRRMSRTEKAASGIADRWFLTALILLGFGLRLLRLDFQPLWWDEGYSVWFATHPLGPMMALTAQDIHPPLYYALLHGWTLLLGARPVALRLFSVVVGTLTIPAIYLAGRRMFTMRTALLAALLAAISPLAVFYSQEVRMYGLVALLSTGILPVAWQALGPTDRPAHWKNLLLYVLLMTAALYTQYYAVFLPVGLTLFAVWQWWRGRRTPDASVRAPGDLSGTNVTLSESVSQLPTQRASSEESEALTRRDSSLSWLRSGELGTEPLRMTRKKRADLALGHWLGAQVIVALLYLPWVIYAGPKLVPYVSQKVVQDADRPLGLLVYIGRHLSAFLAGHLEGPLAPYWPAALLLLVPVALGLIWVMRSGAKGSTNQRINESANCHSAINNPQSAIVMLLFVLASALLLGWLVGLRYPFFPDRGERLLLLALPALLLLVAAGLDALVERARPVGYALLGLGAAVSVASLVAFYATPRYTQNDYRPLMARIVEQGLPGDTVLAVYPWQAGYWRAYGDPGGAVDVLTPGATWGAPVAGALEAAMARGRVWFPAHQSLGAILETRIEDYLRTHAVDFLNEWHGPNTRLSAWARVPAASPETTTPVRFLLPEGDAGAVELSGAGAQIDPVPAANAVMPLSLSWRSESAPPVLDVSVRLTDDLGHIWAQHDYEPLGGAAGYGETSCDACGDKSVLRGGQARPWEAQDRLGLLIPAGTPPGRYHVEVVLRPEGGGRPLHAVSAGGRTLGESARLFDITVGPADRTVGPERLPIATRRPVDMQGGLRLLGYSMDETPATPGDERKINLFWQARDTPAAEYTAFVQLQDREGRVAAGWEAPPGAGYPTQVWAPGTLIRTQVSIRVPANLADGSYRLIAGLFRAQDKSRLLTAGGDDAFALGRLKVQGRPHETNRPNPARVVDIELDNLARLVGYDLAQPVEGVKPGENVPLTLYWQAMGASERPYTVFVHLLDDRGDILGYGDSEPAGGQLPTTGWLAGEYVKDPHEVAIRADAPPGTYRLAIGLYNPATGERLKTPDGADYIVLDPVVPVR